MKVNSVHVFYHNADPDGHASGFLLKWAIDEGILNINRKRKDIILHSFNYGFDISWENINKNDVVFWADVSGTKEEMKLMHNKVNGNMYWIDHHDSILSEHSDLHEHCMGLRDFKKSACQNVLQFIMDNGRIDSYQDKILKNIKPFIDVIGYYDAWDKSVVQYNEDLWNKEYASVKFAFDAIQSNPNTDFGISFWENVIEYAENDDISDLISDMRLDGNYLLKYINNRNMQLCKSYGFSAEFEGLNVFALNQGIGGSHVFNSINTAKYDAVMCFIKSGKNNLYSVSLYSDKEDVNLNAQLNHIGFKGHDKAGGFRCKEFNILMIDNHKRIIVK